MMKIEEVVGDLILVVLDNHEPLAKIGIDQDKIFVYVNGYDENGMWIHHPNFQIPNLANQDKTKTKSVEASILIPWAFIVSIAHFPGEEGFDNPSPFDLKVGFE